MRFPETCQQFPETEISGFVPIQPFPCLFFFLASHIQEDHFWELLSFEEAELGPFGLCIVYSAPSPIQLVPLRGVRYAWPPPSPVRSLLQLVPGGPTLFPVFSIKPSILANS